MPLKLMYITNDERVAKVAESSGVDWIFVDLEILGKEKRQGHLDTVISRHSMDDVKRLASVLTHSKLLVRLNPLHNGSRQEIDCAIADGADILMLLTSHQCLRYESLSVSLMQGCKHVSFWKRLQLLKSLTQFLLKGASTTCMLA